jgi:hypothetical protein
VDISKGTLWLSRRNASNFIVEANVPPVPLLRASWQTNEYEPNVHYYCAPLCCTELPIIRYAIIMGRYVLIVASVPTYVSLR